MREALLPFIGYILLQFFVATVGLIVVREKELGFSGLLKCWIFGQMLLFAVFQIFAVPMILLRWKFDFLFWSYCGVCLALLCFGCWRFNKGVRIKLRKPVFSPLAFILLFTAVLLILYQSCIYFFGIHLDEDDARWLAQANDAIEYGNMITRNFHTGEFAGVFFLPKDVTSPWPMMVATLARVLHTNVSTIAHSFYPTIEIWVVYGAYWLIGRELYTKIEARLSFLLLSAVCLLFFGGSVYTQGAFSLVRIWQGKATVAAVIIPSLLYIFIRINKTNNGYEWLKAAIIGCAACLFSGMGISISLIMLGAYGLYNILAYKNLKRLLVWIAVMLPSLIFTLLYYFIKG